ncbi:Crp/Fnr family transcriptional regulator [Pedobacter agri]|uniref:Crp/Fnr family transcriptional regulator n=1 Tax=Pedobacter agri TaxID=454586 RepID=A0A9X3IA36_9SPHI|nr:Crp/Fnr family transcriptional regulator [Pedobacter agri]MCX3265634.1 Crp/Fnr family transcriptional regulator [Pedobacter agri]
MADLELLLAYFKNFYPLSEGLCRYLSGCIKEITYEKNHVLQTGVEATNQMWFIAKGAVKVSRLNSDDNFGQVTVWFFKTNEVIVSLHDSYITDSWEYSLTTTSRCRMISISPFDLQQLSLLFPEFDRIRKQILESIIISVAKHLELVQHCNAFQRYEQVSKNDPSLFGQASLKDIASYLGMSMSTLKKLRYPGKNTGKKNLKDK